MVLTTNETLIKEWQWANEKKKFLFFFVRETFNYTLTITDQRIVFCKKSELSEEREELPISLVESVSVAYRKGRKFLFFLKRKATFSLNFQTNSGKGSNFGCGGTTIKSGFFKNLMASLTLSKPTIYADTVQEIVEEIGTIVATQVLSKAK